MTRAFRVVTVGERVWVFWSAVFTPGTNAPPKLMWPFARLSDHTSVRVRSPLGIVVCGSPMVFSSYASVVVLFSIRSSESFERSEPEWCDTGMQPAIATQSANAKSLFTTGLLRGTYGERDTINDRNGRRRLPVTWLDGEAARVAFVGRELLLEDAEAPTDPPAVCAHDAGHLDRRGDQDDKAAIIRRAPYGEVAAVHRAGERDGLRANVAVAPVHTAVQPSLASEHKANGDRVKDRDVGQHRLDRDAVERHPARELGVVPADRWDDEGLLQGRDRHRGRGCGIEQRSARTCQQISRDARREQSSAFQMFHMTTHERFLRKCDLRIRK